MNTINPFAKAPVKLSFSVSKGRKCFELTPKEKDELGMKPDDWAWRFLRLNEKYRQAYADARARQAALTDSAMKGCPKPPDYALPSPRVTFNVAECRQRFGLSTWLDPEELVLPSLEDGESWFAPLMSVVAETRFSAMKSTIFGYKVLHKHLEVGSTTNNPPYKARVMESSASKMRPPWMDGSVWFAIDCSIPPDGQLASIDFIAKQYADEMRKENLTKFHYYQEEPVIQALSIEPDFAGIKFRAPFASNAIAPVSFETWRMLRIGLVGPRVRDIEICRLALKDAHLELVAAALVGTPFKDKFKIDLEGNYENGGDNGNVLKAHVMLAELNAAGITKAKDIIDFLVCEGAGSQVHLDRSLKNHSYWSDNAPERGILFENYAKISTEYVRHGYKWLIHSQNPPEPKN